MSEISQEGITEQRPAPQWRSTPITPASMLLSFDPALAMEIGETKAIILQKVWDWMEYNRINDKQDHCIDGRWYAYNSAKQWRDNHFPYLSVPTVKKAFQELERDGFVYRVQALIHNDDYRQWVTIPSEARARIAAISAANTPTKKYPGADKKYPPQDKKYQGADKKYPQQIETQIQNHQIKSTNTQTTTAQAPADTEIDAVPGSPDVVVVSPPRPTTREAETGELIIEAEVAQNRHDEGPDDEPALIKAEANAQERTTAPIPSSAPPLSPLAADVLRAELVRFGVVPGAIARLIQTYQEADIRYVMELARAATNIHTPPGFLIKELEKGEAGVLGQRDQKMLTFEHPSPAPTRFIAPDESLFTDDEREEIALIGFDRFMALRQMKELVHEHSDPNLEYA